MKVYTYQVRGFGEFPIDMLRYDDAYPASETDSAIIGETQNRIVTVRSNRQPTSARWASFLWDVVDVQERRA